MPRAPRLQTERMTRLQHHLSQFVHMRTCARLIAAREKRKAVAEALAGAEKPPAPAPKELKSAVAAARSPQP